MYMCSAPLRARLSSENTRKADKPYGFRNSYMYIHKESRTRTQGQLGMPLSIVGIAVSVANHCRDCRAVCAHTRYTIVLKWYCLVSTVNSVQSTRAARSSIPPPHYSTRLYTNVTLPALYTQHRQRSPSERPYRYRPADRPA